MNRYLPAVTNPRLPVAPVAAVLIVLLLASVAGARPAAAYPAKRPTIAPRLVFHDDTVIYEATAGEPGAHEIVRTPAGVRKWSPTWSPDGRRLAYVAPLCAQLPAGCQPDVGLTGSAVYVADVRTGDARPVPSMPHMAVWDLEWSPRGDRFTFVAYKVLETGFVWGLGATHSDIYVVNADGKQLTAVTVDGVSAEPTWSPDGKRLAYRTLRGGGGGIYVSSPGLLSPPTRVSTDGLHDSAFSPTWSPDGRSIAYVAYKLPPDSSLTNDKPEIWVARADGSGQYRTRTSGYNIDWSPDSRSLAYDTVSADRERMEIHVLRLRGRSRFVAVGEVPRWAPDGRHLAINVPGTTQPYRSIAMVDLRDGSVIPIQSEHEDYSIALDYRWTR